MKTFTGWRAVGRVMRWARQQGIYREVHTDGGALSEMVWILNDERGVTVMPSLREGVQVDVSRKPEPGRPHWMGGLIDATSASTILRFLAALDVIPAELAEVHDERPVRCAWCHRLGHAAEQHPLPKGHPQYDAFYDATDNELIGIVINALGPGREADR